LLTRLRQLLNHNWLVRFRQDRSIREALFVFLLTRSLVFLIFFTVPLATVASHPEAGYYDAFISFEHSAIARHLRTIMARGDVGHYKDISELGYQRAPFDGNDRGSQRFAFFPLHPMLMWGLRHVTSDQILWSAVLCNIFFFLALVLLHKLTLAFGYDDSTAGRTIFYLAAFPLSYFFSVPMTESLFVLLTVASFYAAKREHWWAAGLIGLCASATRVTGVLLLPSLLVLSWQMYRSLPIKKIVGLLLIPFGLFAYMFYSWWLSGDALAFKHANEAWGRKPEIFFLRKLLEYLVHPYYILEGWHFHLANAVAALLCFVCIYILLRRREWSLAFYTSASIVIALSSGILQSLDRYTMGFFPVFMALGLAMNSERWDQATRFVFIFLLGIMTTLYAAGYSNALT